MEPTHAKLLYVPVKHSELLMEIIHLVIQAMIDFKVIDRDELGSLLHVHKNIEKERYEP